MITLDIVTPEKRILLEEGISIVTVPTSEGEIGVMTNHIPIYSQLVSGELKYKKDESDYFVAIHGGFIEFANNTLTVLADQAARAEEIDEAAAELARKRAEDAMAQKVTDVEFAEAESNMRRALIDLRVARKRRT
jgi:F-type H+-transporting ATPase subunit epsilon